VNTYSINRITRFGKTVSCSWSVVQMRESRRLCLRSALMNPPAARPSLCVRRRCRRTLTLRQV